MTVVARRMGIERPYLLTDMEVLTRAPEHLPMRARRVARNTAFYRTWFFIPQLSRCNTNG